MIRLLMSMGPVGPIMLIISLVIVILTIIKTIHVLDGSSTNRVKLERGLDAILFWGVFSAVLGFFGQVMGHYKGLNALIHAGAVNPKAVFMGLAECLSSTLFGLTILLISSLVWFTLRSLVRRRLARAS